MWSIFVCFIGITLENVCMTCRVILLSRFLGSIRRQCQPRTLRHFTSLLSLSFPYDFPYRYFLSLISSCLCNPITLVQEWAKKNPFTEIVKTFFFYWSKSYQILWIHNEMIYLCELLINYTPTFYLNYTSKSRFKYVNTFMNDFLWNFIPLFSGGFF